MADKFRITYDNFSTQEIEADSFTLNGGFYTFSLNRKDIGSIPSKNVRSVLPASTPDEVPAEIEQTEFRR